MAVAGSRAVSAFGGEDGVVRLFDSRGNPAGTLGAAGDPAVTALAFDQEGGVVAGRADGSLSWWRGDGTAVAGVPAAPAGKGPLLFLEWSPDAAHLLLSDGSGVVRWNEARSLLRRSRAGAPLTFVVRPPLPAIQAPAPLAGLAWRRTLDSRGQREFLAVMEDGGYYLSSWGNFRTRSGAWRRLPEGGVRAVAGLSDGSFLVLTDGGDGRCRVWALSSDGSAVERVAVLEGHGAVVSALLDPGAGAGGRARAVTACSDGTLRCFALSAEELLDLARARVPRGVLPEERELLPGLAPGETAPPGGGRAR